MSIQPGPKCRRCGHAPCPMCEDWCDDLGCVCHEEHDDSCDFDPAELAAWLEAIAPTLERARREGLRIYEAQS